MEHVSNKEKAKEIAKKHKQKCYYAPHGDLDNSFEECYQSAIEAMEWKDKEWAERFKNAFQGLWTASLSVEDFSNKTETTIEFKLVTRE